MDHRPTAILVDLRRSFDVISHAAEREMRALVADQLSVVNGTFKLTHLSADRHIESDPPFMVFPSLARRWILISSTPPPSARWKRIELFEGVLRKTLLIDKAEDSESFLLRIRPGAICPAYSHTKTEECLMLECEMIICEVRFRAGDYHAAPRNIAHLPISSEIAALRYVRGELPT